MHEFKTWHDRTIGAKAVAALEKNHFTACYCSTRQEAVTQILEWIPAGATVGVGGSWTVNELGILEQLAERGHTVFNHNQPGLNAAQKQEMRLREQTCDVFLTGSNAVTLDGKLVNTDGAGNRVSAMIFGPQKVIVIAGVNKIVKDTAAAEERIKLVASPMNNKRLQLPNPCAASGECMDCQGPNRICNVTVTMHKRPMGTDLAVVIIGEELGF